MERERLVTHPRGRPRRQATDDAIAAAAIALVRDVGYDAVTIEAIAARAGVGKATIYRRWRAKEPLVVDAIGSIVRDLPVPDTGSLRGDLRALLRSASRLYGDPATRLLLSGLVGAMARSTPIGRAVRSGFVATWVDAVAAIVRNAGARGEIRRGIDARFVDELMSGPLLYRFLINGDAIDESFARRVAAFVARGLGS